MGSIVLSADYICGSGHTESHLHDSHQLLYVTQGQARITVSENIYLATPGTMVLISRFEAHSVLESTPDYRRYSLQIAPQISTYGKMVDYSVLSVLTNRPANFLHAVDMSACGETEALLRQITAESAQKPAMHQTMQDLKLLQVLLLLVRLHPELVTQEDAALSLVQQIQFYLENHYASRLTLDGLAKYFHLSASHLSHQFKRITGTSVMGYLQACRLAAAKQQLAQTDLSISHIIDICGYSDSSNFSHAFRSATGLTPTQFRRQYRQ